MKKLLAIAAFILSGFISYVVADVTSPSGRFIQIRQNLQPSSTFYVSSGTFQSYIAANGIMSLPHSATPPPSDCTTDDQRGRIYIDTNSTTGQQLYACEGTLGWKLQGDGGSGSGPQTTILVKDGGSSIVTTSTLNFTGATFVVTNSGGEGLVAIDFSSVPSRSDVVLNQNSLQSGATFFVSSGSVNGQLSVTSIKFPNGTIQVSSPTTGAGSSPGGATQNIQFNNAGSFGGVSNFNFNPSSNTVTILGDYDYVTPLSDKNALIIFSTTPTANLPGAGLAWQYLENSVSTKTVFRILPKQIVSGVSTGTIVDFNVSAFGVSATSNTVMRLGYTNIGASTFPQMIFPLGSSRLSWLGNAGYIEDSSAGDMVLHPGNNNRLRIGRNAGTEEILVFDTGSNDGDITWDGTNDFFKVSDDVSMQAQNELRFADSDSSNYVGFKSPGTVASNTVWTLPSADGGVGQIPYTDGNKVLAFSNGLAFDATSYSLKLGTFTTTQNIFTTDADGDLWILANASYSATTGRFTRINANKVAWGIEMQGGGIFPGEVDSGWVVWRATGSAPGVRDISPTFGSVGGWELGYDVTSNRDLVVGGGALEMDGFGTFPYGRLIHSNLSGTSKTGVGRNIYNNFSEHDSSIYPDLFVGFSSDTFVVQHGTFQVTPNLRNLMAISTGTAPLVTIGQMSVNAIRWPDGTIQVSSPSAAGVAGGGGSALEVFSNFDATRSSPTASLSLGDTLKLSVTGSTAVISVDPANVILSTQTLQAGATFFVSSGTVSGNITLGSATISGWSFYGNNDDYMRIGPKSSGMTLRIDRTEGEINIGNAASGSPVILKSQNSNGSGTISYTGPTNGYSVNSHVGLASGKVLRLYDTIDSNYVGLKASATVSATNTYILPPTAGTAGQAILTDGNNNLYFGTASGGGGGSALEVFSNFDGTRSSPTASISVGDALKLSVTGSTAVITIDFSSVTSRADAILNQNTLQSGATFYVSSGTAVNLNSTTANLTNAAIGTSLTTNMYANFGSAYRVPYLDATNKFATDAGFIFADFAQILYGPSILATTQMGAYNGATVAMYDNDASNFVGLKSSASLSTNNTYVMPATAGTAGQAILTDGANNLYFGNTMSSGSTFYIQNTNSLQDGATFYVSSGTVAGQFNVISASATGVGSIREYFSFNPRTSSFQPGSNLTLNMVGNSGFILRGANLDTSSYSDFKIIPPISGNTILTSVSFDGGNEVMSVRTNEVRISTKVVVTQAKSVEFNDFDNTNFVGFKSSEAVSTNNTYVLPASSGAANQLIFTDGSNNLGFKDVRRAMKLSEVFAAEQAKLPGTSPCVISNSTAATIPSLLCDASTDESASWSTILTEYSTTTLKASIYYTMVSTNSGAVVHNLQVMCASTTYTADLDVENFGSVNASTITVPSSIGRIGVATVTISAMPTGCVSGGLLVLKYNRDANAGADTAPGDIELRKIWLFEP